MRNVYVIGVHTIPFGKYVSNTIKELSALTYNGCLKDSGISPKDIQAMWFSNTGWGEFGQGSIRGQVALRHTGVEKIPITNIENACAGASTAFHHAWYGVAGGLYDITLAVGVEKLYQKNKTAMFAGFMAGIDFENCISIAKEYQVYGLTEEQKKDVAVFRQKYQSKSLAIEKHPRSRISDRLRKLKDDIVVAIRIGEILGYDTVKELRKLSPGNRSPFMDIYGFAARKHMEQFGSTVEQLAMIASKNHFNGMLNPNAQYRFEVPVEKILSDRIVTWPLTRSMCAPIGDGAASAILASEDMVKRFGVSSRAVKVRASVLGSGSSKPFGFDEPEIGERLSRLAYEIAGIGPQDINLAEVHDATAYGELRQTENLGFCPKGEGGKFAESGNTALHGRIPINTSGGLISRGHPVGASGLAQLHEIVTQLRGEAKQRQVNSPRIGLAENGGGALGYEEAAMCVHILEKP
ncbi:MAG: thiolase family protein [Desulfobacterales bacterium]|nr:thiolase family protein [Desulfobacterales bacterium]